VGPLLPWHDASSGCGWRRVAASILNKESRTADKGWSSSLEVGQALATPNRKRNSMLRNVARGLRALWHFITIICPHLLCLKVIQMCDWNVRSINKSLCIDFVRKHININVISLVTVLYNLVSTTWGKAVALSAVFIFRSVQYVVLPVAVLDSDIWI
jgi:hypothetical protein